MPSAQAPRFAESVLKAENLCKQVSSPEGLLTIVEGVSFDIAAGESVALVGASGAGKSSLLKAGRLLRLLVDAAPPYSGLELAKYAGVTAGYVSRLLEMLDRAMRDTVFGDFVHVFSSSAHVTAREASRSGSGVADFDGWLRQARAGQTPRGTTVIRGGAWI